MMEEMVAPLVASMSASAWDLLKGAFMGSAGLLGDGQWGVAVGFNNKMTVVMSVFTVLVALFQVGRCLFQGRMRDAIKPAVAAVLAWPVTAICVWATIMSVAAMDKLVAAMLGGAENDSLQDVFLAASAMGAIQGATGGPAGAASGALGANLILLLIVWVFSLILSMVMIFRNFALIVAVSFASVALMLIPADVTRSWAKRWAETVIALILTKPIASGILILSSELVATADSLASSMMALVAIIVACASPMAAIALVKFTGAQLGADAGNEASRATGTAARMSGRGARTASRALTRVVR